jgi:hypothetical protein
VFKNPTINFNALFNSAALLKQQRQEILRGATHTIVKRVEKSNVTTLTKQTYTFHTGLSNQF